jgi:hypothetical protein
MVDLVVQAAQPPALPAKATLVGEAIEVTLCSSTPSYVTLMFDIGRHDPDDILIVQVDENGILRPMLYSYGGGVNLTTSGTFAAITLVAPDGCEAESFSGSVTANNDTELAELDGVTRFDGDLTLGGAVSSLSSLACLTSIGGTLTVSGTTMLTHLELDALAFVRRGISVSSNANLERVSLPSLLFTGNVFGESFLFEDLAKLASIDVPNLLDAEGAMGFGTIGGETSEPLVLDFKSLRAIDGTLGVVNALNLRSVDLSSLRTLRDYGSLTFADLPELTNLDLRNLGETPGGVRLYWLGSLASAPLVLDLRSLDTVGADLVLENVYNLENLDTLQRLESVSGDIVITNSNLIQVDGLANLREVGGEVRFQSHELLRSIDLRSLHSARTSLEFELLPRLRTIDLRALVQGREVSLFGVGGEADAPLTVNLTALTSVGRVLLTEASNLRDLSGFVALQQVLSLLEIRSNASLTSLRGLGELTSVGGDLYVTDNAMLPTCEAWWLRDHLQNGVQGSLVIRGNLSDECE